MNYGLVNKPKGPGATQRVWDIANELTLSLGRMARRKEVIDAYVSEGGNANTASTQYYYWKTARDAAASTGAAPSAGEASPAEDVPDPDHVLHLDVAEDGSLRLPPGILRGLEIPDGGVLSGRLVNGQLTLVAPLVELRQLRGLLAHLKRPGESVVDEFLSERRAMWGEE